MVVKTFRELSAGSLEPDVLQDQIASTGYALIRDLIPKDAVLSVLAEVTSVLSAAQWLSEEFDPLDCVPEHGLAYGDPDPVFKRVYQEVFNLESLHALPHQPALRSVMKMLV